MSSPHEFRESDQHPGVALVFAVLTQWESGEDLRVAVLQLEEEVGVCVRVAPLLQVHQIRSARLSRVATDNLVEVVSGVYLRKTMTYQ